MVKVSVVKCDSYDDQVFSAVAEALDMINAKAIIKPGMKVLIKPNLLIATDPSKCVTTHPLVIDALCKYVIALNAKPCIGESSGAISDMITEKAFKECGMKAIAEKYSIPLVNFDTDEHVMVSNEKNVVLKKFQISKKLKGADVIINACKLKTHMLTGITCAVKNMYGILPGKAKANGHVIGRDATKFSDLILDIYLTVTPAISILDGIIGMEGNGPSGGKLKKTGLIVASTNGIALDKVVSEIIGFRNLLHLRQAEKRNMMPSMIQTIGLKGVKVHYKKPMTYNLGIGFFFGKVLSYCQNYLVADKNKCKKCMHCVKVCPQKTVYISKASDNAYGFPYFDKSKCILCYCCHEMCPYKAIVIKRPLMGKMLDLAIKAKRIIMN